MRALWYLSLVVLILGNIIDGCATFYRLTYDSAPWREASLLSLWIWDMLGFVPALILVKFVAGGLLLFLIWRIYCSRVYGPWVGVRLSTFFGFFAGILLALGGTGVVGVLALEVILAVSSPEFVLAHWDVLPTLFWLAVLFFSGVVMGAATVVLLVLDERRLADGE